MLALVASLFLLQGPESAGPPPPPPPPPPAAARLGIPAPPPPPAPPRAAVRVERVERIEQSAGEADLLRGEWPAQPSGKRVTLEGKETIDDAVAEIGKAAGWSVATNTGRLGDRMLLLRLNDVPVEEALRAVLSGSGLVATRRGTIIAVAPGLGPTLPPRPAKPVLTGFDKPSGKSFTGDFEDEDTRDALLEVGRKTGLSITLPPGVHGKVTAHFKEVPVEEVLRAILPPAGLTAERQGNMVIVSRRGDRLGRFESLEALGDIGEEITRMTEDATRTAEREARRAEREARQAAGGSRRDRESVGGDVVVEPGQAARDVTAVRGSVTLRPGAEAREVVAVLGSVDLEAGSSARQVVAIAGDVHVGPGASVEKDAVSIGGRVLVDPAGDVGGQKVTVGVPALGDLVKSLGLRGHEEAESGGGWVLAKWVAKFGVMLLLGFLLLTLFPRRVDAVAAALQANPGKSLLAGLLGLLAQPLLTLLLAVTLVGIPLIAVQVLGVLVAYLLGITAAAVLLGRALPAALHRGTGILQLAIGLWLLLLGFAIPFLGWLLWATLVMATFGAVLRTRFGQTPVLETVAAPVPPPIPPAPTPMPPPAA
jgi:hypothetical protein